MNLGVLKYIKDDEKGQKEGKEHKMLIYQADV